MIDDSHIKHFERCVFVPASVRIRVYINAPIFTQREEIIINYSQVMEHNISSASNLDPNGLKDDGEKDDDDEKKIEKPQMVNVKWRLKSFFNSCSKDFISEAIAMTCSCLVSSES